MQFAKRLLHNEPARLTTGDANRHREGEGIGMLCRSAHGGPLGQGGLRGLCTRSGLEPNRDPVQAGSRYNVPNRGDVVVAV